VKLRRCPDEARARRYVDVLAELDDPALARVLLRHGRVVVEEWIDGVSLAELPLSTERLAQAASLLGRMHARRRGARRVLPSVRRMRDQLARLVETAAITRDQAGAVLRFTAPERAIVGAIHVDLCADNLVEDAAGRVISIDNEHLCCGFIDYDLARTWHRWPMPPDAWQRFGAHYGREPVAWAFWRARVLVESVYLRRGTPGMAGPLARLHAISARHSAGES
jgi:thiamine kinase-like enzyme